MTLIVRSARVWYGGKDRIDVTVKSGTGIGKYLTPSWDMVREFKEGNLSWEEYEKKYLGILRDVWREKRWVFRQLFLMGSVTFVCYCRNDKHCHRRLLREVLKKIGKKCGIEVIDGGESSQRES